MNGEDSKNLPELSSDILFFEYTKAANPLAKGAISQIPFAELPSSLHESGATRVISFDLSASLDCEAPATSPNLSASFLRICAGEVLVTHVNATSELFYVMRGKGKTVRDAQSINWQTGDFVIMPGGKKATHWAENDAALYWINDQPLLTYLGVKVDTERFATQLYPAAECKRQLQIVRDDPAAADRNRVSVLLANKKFPQTLTATHTLWAMFGILPIDAVQPPHRHNSVALDLILECQPGCYSLISRDIDQAGRLINPVRQDWKPYSAFITPPYYWHSHHNESGAVAHLIPIQDAGIQTYMRTLDIEFAHPVQTKGKSPLVTT